MEDDKQKNEQLKNFRAWGFAWELGYTIAIPIIIFALAGRLADKELGTSPLLLLIGILFSIVITTYLIYRKVAKIF